MSIRSRVGVETETGIRSIYVHFDGYPDGVGRVLAIHYAADPAKVSALMDLGDAASLREYIDDCGCEDRFGDTSGDLRGCRHVASHSRFYRRDRAGRTSDARRHADREAYVASGDESWADWLYLLTPQGWLVREVGASSAWIPLQPRIPCT